MKNKCEVEVCNREQHARGLCWKHYIRRWRGRDPHAPSCLELSPEDRFWARLAPQNPITGCIEWTGLRNKDGYGLITRDGSHVLAHRFSYTLKHGPIPSGMNVLHTCDNPPCCNYEHLFLGTHADNAADKMAKGRGSKGESHGASKLTEADVTEIRRRIAIGEVQRRIAEDFNVSAATVCNIKAVKVWKHRHQK